MPNIDKPSSSPEIKNAALDFNKNLDALKYDEAKIADEMYEVLSGTLGYSLIKSEILNVADPSMKKITREDFDKYVQSQGGSKFLKEIFARGVVGLRGDFKKQKEKFASSVKTLQLGQDLEGIGIKMPSEPPEGDFALNPNELNFYNSGVAKKIFSAASFNAISKKEIGKLTFEQAYNSERVYSQYLTPTIKGAAEYGLSWFEYTNRTKRQAKVRRTAVATDVAKASPKPTLASLNRDAKLDPKIPPVGLSGQPVEAAKPKKTLEQARNELESNIIPKIETLLREPEVAKYGVKIERDKEGRVVKLVDSKGDVVVSIAVLRGGDDGVVFSVSGVRIDISDPNEAFEAVKKRLFDKLRSKERAQEKQLAEAGEVNSVEWEKAVTAKMDELIGKYKKEGGVWAEGVNIYFYETSKSKYVLIINGHNACDVSLDPKAQKISFVAQQINAVVDGVGLKANTKVYRNVALGTFTVEKDRMDYVEGLITREIPKRYEDKKQGYINEILAQQSE